MFDRRNAPHSCKNLASLPDFLTGNVDRPIEYLDHKLHTHQDHPEEYVAVNCFICSGGLALCVRCGGAEGAMPTDCPGVQMSELQIEDVYAGRKDYRAGEWVDSASPHSPYSISQPRDCI